MKFECSKRVRGLLRQLATAAYERELQQRLDELEASFARCRRGDIDVNALAREIDRFAKGPDRRHLEQRYHTAGILHMAVAQAIVRRILKADEVPREVLEALGKAIEFYRQGLADGTISFDEGD